jgi:hypothetical protein
MCWRTRYSFVYSGESCLARLVLSSRWWRLRTAREEEEEEEGEEEDGHGKLKRIFCWRKRV